MKLASRFFSHGWWLITLLAIFTIAVFIKNLAIPLWHGRFSTITGDGKHVNSYGFNLTPCLVPRGQILASGNVKNGLLALNHPRTLSVRQVRALNNSMRDSGGFIASPNRVIGVVIHGHARAYPIAMLNWHEVVNDRLGSTPIAVTYDGFCNSAIVLGRQVGSHTLRFGYSGLVYQSNALLYDHQPQRQQESLWSQIQARAITGPAAHQHEHLQVLPCQLVTWGFWRKEHPQTRMIAGVRSLYPAYRKNPYGAYTFQQHNFRFPVSPLWHRPGFPPKTQLIIVQFNHQWHPVFFPHLFRLANSFGLAEMSVAGHPFVFHCQSLPGSQTVCLVAPAHQATAYALVFAWYAQHPGEFPIANHAATPTSAAK